MDLLKAHFNSIHPLTDEIWADLKPLFKKQILPAEDYFIREGQYARQLGFLESGCIRAFFLDPEGKEYNKQFFVGPALIGAYTSLLTHTANKIAQQALTESVIWIAEYEKVSALYDKYHSLERMARKTAEFLFIEKEQKELEMALLDATQRYLKFREQFPGLEQEIPQYHIASYLSITPTQLSRVRKGLIGK